jgi:hypothetical protein
VRAEARFATSDNVGVPLLKLRVGELRHPETAAKRKILADGRCLATSEELAGERHVRTERIELWGSRRPPSLQKFGACGREIAARQRYAPEKEMPVMQGISVGPVISILLGQGE